MSFIKNIFQKLKTLPSVFKKGSLKNLLNYFKTHRLMALISLIILVVLIVGIIFLFKFFEKNSIETSSSQKDKTLSTADISDLSIKIPENAFPYPKSFTINKIPRDTLFNEIKKLGNFYSDIYELTPTDGRDDLALDPITYEYKIPNEFYYGDEYNNAELLYVEDKQNPVVKVFSGGEIVRNQNQQPILRAKGFHGSLVGLRINNPIKQELGLKKIIEKPDTLKPDVLLVPGIDSNFKGFLPNTMSNINPQGNNLWEVTFEDRSIWAYEYPLIKTRSANYVREAQNYFQKKSMTSYVKFEAEKLSQSLKSSDHEFDIIAHGIGGIIARYAVENYAVSNVRKMVLVSVPNTGTNIVNPSFLNLLYGKDTNVLSQIYGIDTDTIRYLTRNNLGYLENVNVFYTDLLPYADVIKTLENSIRSDIDYFFLGGNKPDFDADLKDSQFAKFYPENTKGKGDGIVSVYSSIFPSLEESPNTKDNIISRVFPFSFSDIFLQKETLNLIYKYLEEGIEVVEIPEFEDDTFKEWLFDSENSTMSFSSDDYEMDFSSTTTSTSTSVENDDVSATQNYQSDTKITSDVEDWKTPIIDKTDGTKDTKTTIVKNDTNAKDTKTTIPATVASDSNTKTQDKIDDVISILRKVDSTQDDKITSNDTRIIANQFVPDSTNWNTNCFPDSFSDINNMIIYEYTKQKVPQDWQPYGMIEVGDSLYLFERGGILSYKNGTFEKISDESVSAYTKHSNKLYVVQGNILTSFIEGDPASMEYLMFDAPVLSIGMTDSSKYYLLSQNGLTFETPSNSYQIKGHYGQIIMYGIYPYIITDAAVYLYDGKDCKNIYEPYSSDIQLKSGLIYNSTLYLLASDYMLRAVSLDGKKMLKETSNSMGGIKLVVNNDKLIIAGKNKFNIIDYSYRKPEGTYFTIPEKERVIDAVFLEGTLLGLIREGDSLFIKKIAVLE